MTALDGSASRDTASAYVSLKRMLPIPVSLAEVSSSKCCVSGSSSDSVSEFSFSSSDSWDSWVSLSSQAGWEFSDATAPGRSSGEVSSLLIDGGSGLGGGAGAGSGSVLLFRGRRLVAWDLMRAKALTAALRRWRVGILEMT